MWIGLCDRTEMSWFCWMLGMRLDKTSNIIIVIIVFSCGVMLTPAAGSVGCYFLFFIFLRSVHEGS